MRQKTPAGGVVGWELASNVPVDALPMGGDGRYLYSPSTRQVINWEACVDSEIVRPEPPAEPPGPPPTP